MKLLGSIKKVNKNQNRENVPRLKTINAVLIHWDNVNNDDQRNSKVLYTFALNKSFGQLSDISCKNVIFLKLFHSEFSYIEVWFT